MRKYSISNIKAYLVGKLRYRCYDNAWSMFIRKHILEQIDQRLSWMSAACYNNGSCEMCGCETPALQMANKACDKPCYPTMMSRRDWKMFRRGGMYYDRALDGFWLQVDGELIFKQQKDYVGK
jgi:hypothetical protein